MVSVIGDAYKDKWRGFPETVYTNYPEVSRIEFDSLRKEVIALKELLQAANKFDKATRQPHCETEDKVELLLEVAKAVGVNLDDVLKPRS